MHTLHYSALRESLAASLDQVYDDHQPMLITRKNGKNAVLISYEDYKSMEETAYLLSSPENAKRLLQSIAHAKSGKVIKKELVEG